MRARCGNRRSRKVLQLALAAGGIVRVGLFREGRRYRELNRAFRAGNKSGNNPPRASAIISSGVAIARNLIQLSELVHPPRKDTRKGGRREGKEREGATR